jgi:hypothetical protein
MEILCKKRPQITQTIWLHRIWDNVAYQRTIARSIVATSCLIMALKAALSGMSLRQHTATTTSEDKQSFNRTISPSWKRSSLPERSDFGHLPDDEIVVQQPDAIFSIIFGPLTDSIPKSFKDALSHSDRKFW